MTDDGVSELARRLRELKDRSGRSYTGLAGRAALSRSSVHRYCSGAAVPPDFDTVSRLALACGASREEPLDLHRMWVLAGAAKPPPPDRAVPEAALEVPPTGPPPPVRRSPMPTLALAAVLILLSLLALNAFTGLGWTGDAGSGAAAELKAGTSPPILLTAACATVVALGDRGDCVRQVQSLLTERGAKIVVDANFGVETLRRVVAFQVLAGLPATGRVDDATKQALVSAPVSMRAWSADRVERRIREVFRTAGVGDEAVHVARCHSRLDALWVGPDPQGPDAEGQDAAGPRGWGVFQLTDDVLGRYDGTRHMALDPEWNIQAAHWIWAEHRDFRDWPACVGVSGTPTPSPKAGSKAPRQMHVSDSALRPAKRCAGKARLVERVAAKHHPATFQSRR